MKKPVVKRDHHGNIIKLPITCAICLCVQMDRGQQACISCYKPIACAVLPPLKGFLPSRTHQPLQPQQIVGLETLSAEHTPLDVYARARISLGIT